VVGDREGRGTKGKILFWGPASFSVI